MLGLNVIVTNHAYSRQHSHYTEGNKNEFPLKKNSVWFCNELYIVRLYKMYIPEIQTSMQRGVLVYYRNRQLPNRYSSKYQSKEFFLFRSILRMHFEKS